jgi:hypothetical protein
VNGVPQEYEIDTIEPKSVQLTLLGRRRDLYFLGPEAVEVRVDAVLIELGRRSFSLTPANVRRPQGVEVRGIEPDRVRVELRKRETRLPEEEASGGKSP